MSAPAWWYEDDVSVWSFDCEPDATDYATEALVISNGIVSWGVAASVFDFD